jgi:nucleotide-binding universal stress UspA family protein
MVPVDLAHVSALEPALKVAADLAGHYNARVTYVGVTHSQPSSVAHNPEEFARKLAEFAAAQKDAHGMSETVAHAITSHDPAVDLDKKLEHAVSELGADLVVMASHIPRHFDLGSHGGRVATHTDASVMLVRA